MKRLILLAAIALLYTLCALPAAAAGETAACNPDDPAQVRLQISVSHVKSETGSINITIYPDDAKHFLDGKYKVGRVYLPALVPVTQACFVVPAPGYYAVALFHDENENRHFDTTLIGLPAEGYGFSNNPTLFLGPPGLGKVRFAAHAGDNPVAVKLKY